MHKSIYISLIFHLTILSVLLSVSGGLIRPPPTLKRIKEITIEAEIVDKPESYNNKPLLKLKGDGSKVTRQYQGLKTKNHSSSVIMNRNDFIYINPEPKRYEISAGSNIKEGTENETTEGSIHNPLPDLSDSHYIKSDGIKYHTGMGENTISIENHIAEGHEVDLLKIIRDSIEKAMVYPPSARKRGIEGKVTLRFRIRPDGDIEEVKIVKGSGSETLDRESKETIKRAIPLPYLKGWIEVPLVFRLE